MIIYGHITIGEELGILNNEDKGWKVDSEHAIKHIKRLVFGFVAIAIVVGIVIQVIIDNTNDLLNTTTLAAEIIFGIFISLVVYIYSKRQHDENQKMTEKVENLMDEIHKTVREEAKIRKEIAEDIAYHMNGKLDLITKTLTHSLQMYENYQNSKNGENENWLNAMKNSHDRCYTQLNFQLNLIEMMKIFGASPARKYWRLLGMLQIKSDFWGDGFSFDANDFSIHIKQCLNESNTLKVAIKSFLPED